MFKSPVIAVITRETRLKGLIARWGTKGAARFRLKQSRALELARKSSGKTRHAKSASTAVAEHEAESDFLEYENEDTVYHRSLDRLRNDFDFGLPVTFVDREYLPNYDFRGCVAAVVVGQDGLVANAAKYVGDVPIVAVNPDPQRIDGILLPFEIANARQAVQKLLKDKAEITKITLAEVTLNDGQRLLAFNDLFVGLSGHASARYVLNVAGRRELQSSSGMIISTGAGSTGWMSSVINMYRGLGRWLGTEPEASFHLPWSDPRLAWTVREPFQSKQSNVELVAGLLNDGDELVIESQMPGRGVIFSDGVEADFLEFNSGTIARIRRSEQRAQLVVG